MMRLALLWLVGWSVSGLGASVPVLRLTGPLNPGSGAYLRDGLDEAARLGAPYVVLVLDSDGGLLPTARATVQKILESPVPVVAYAGPAGARVGSLGALLLVASDVAAMAPEARLGGDLTGESEEYRASRARFESEAAELADTIARARARNAHGASKAVHGKDAVNGEGALRESLIDFTAEDFTALQTRLVGFRLRVPKGPVAFLSSEEVSWKEFTPTFWQRILAFLSDSRFAYGLFFLGVILLALELARPGSTLPGALGAGCVLCSLLLFYWLPISYGALALMVVGLGLIVVEGLPQLRFAGPCGHRRVHPGLHVARRHLRSRLPASAGLDFVVRGHRRGDRFCSELRRLPRPPTPQAFRPRSFGWRVRSGSRPGNAH